MEEEFANLSDGLARENTSYTLVLCVWCHWQDLVLCGTHQDHASVVAQRCRVAALLLPLGQ